jgi:hypothetical protein
LVDLLQSKYGNFVIQKAFQLAETDRREILLSKIDQVLKMGKVNPKKVPAKHVFNFLESKFQIKFDVLIVVPSAQNLLESQPKEPNS